MRKSFFGANVLLCSLTLAFTSCDSGDIEEKTYSVISAGRTVKMTACVSGIAEWGSKDCTLAVAGFGKDKKYALMQRAIPSNTPDGTPVTIVVENLGTDINTLELAVTNSLRKRIVTLETIRLDEYENYGPADTIRLELGNLDASVFGCIQYGIFDKACVQCHGGNGRKAGNLDLTTGNSLSELVDRKSLTKADETRVISGDDEGSLLHKILHEGGENILHYNHVEVLSSQFKNNLEEVRNMIDDWINGL